MSNGVSEARVAAQWWADQLTGTDMRTGVAMSDAFALYAQSRQPAPTVDQIETFRAHVEQAVLDQVVGHESWHDAVTGGKHWGSALRTVGVDYGPEPILADALSAAGLSPLLLPLKTVMWIDPGSVRVARGYNAPIQDLTVPA